MVLGTHLRRDSGPTHIQGGVRTEVALGASARQASHRRKRPAALQEAPGSMVGCEVASASQPDSALAGITESESLKDAGGDV